MNYVQNKDRILSRKDENGKEIPKERYISSEERQKVIDDLRLI